MICAGCDSCFACRLRAKAIAVAPSATPNRLLNSRRIAPRTADPAWERGVTGEHRPDGSFMPYLSPTTGNKVRVKEFAENRSKFEARIKRLKSDPNVFTPT